MTTQSQPTALPKHTPYIHPAEVTYGEDSRRLVGTIPTIRLESMDVLFVSLGALPEQTKAKRDEVMAMLREAAPGDANAALEKTFKSRDKLIEQLNQENLSLVAENKSLREALEEIEKGEGAFSRDQLTFASNVIERSKEIARAALSGGAS